MSRRRRVREEEQWIEEQPIAEEHEAVVTETHHEPIVHDEQPAITAPSAFAWGNANSSVAATNAAEPMVEQDDRMPGESWVQRAYRGPTANNPSVSLKARLRRAAFFDKRERDVAAGKAEPVDMDAGLPEAMTREQERELA